MEPFIQKCERYVSIEPWHQAFPRLISGFSTRNGGNSQSPYTSLNLGFHVGDEPEVVRRNRSLLASDLNMELTRWVGTEQVHEATIKKVTNNDVGLGSESIETAIKSTDGIYTLEKNILLTSLYADCVPLYFYAPHYNAVGLAHAGWRGTVQNIASGMITMWAENEGIPLEDIHVAIGPCISQQAYEVDEKVIAEVDKVWPEDLPYKPYNPSRDQKFFLDLREVNKQLIIEAGVQESKVLVSAICTAEDKRMFSHRAESGKTGRLMSFIGLRLDGE
ncbi:peptidoglycan editing factor PgeF [Alkalihalobacillus sp. MEB130]|uniref:peptidoglycan editing factor PgeF n=1 Tax=Alkalihalobacillus sp. MEB130 TaxID=2976704 RepID=UPI0028DE3969|nr:peptidoglycan editing factor PgeF [Alkalihalobacillus sp. MEB130]MDT8859108.1 peptidoglycan editing factor PgeF [Alkalihalobacillus sp. MEB130]